MNINDIQDNTPHKNHSNGDEIANVFVVYQHLNHDHHTAPDDVQQQAGIDKIQQVHIEFDACVAIDKLIGNAHQDKEKMNECGDYHQRKGFGSHRNKGSVRCGIHHLVYFAVAVAPDQLSAEKDQNNDHKNTGSIGDEIDHFIGKRIGL